MYEASLWIKMLEISGFVGIVNRNTTWDTNALLIKHLGMADTKVSKVEAQIDSMHVRRGRLTHVKRACCL